MICNTLPCPCMSVDSWTHMHNCLYHLSRLSRALLFQAVTVLSFQTFPYIITDEVGLNRAYIVITIYVTHILVTVARLYKIRTSPTVPFTCAQVRWLIGPVYFLRQDLCTAALVAWLTICTSKTCLFAMIGT